MKRNVKRFAVLVVESLLKLGLLSVIASLKLLSLACSTPNPEKIGNEPGLDLDGNVTYDGTGLPSRKE